MNVSSARIGYAPYSRTLDSPGDRRRFCYWAAKRGVPFEVVGRGGHYDVVVVSSRADIVEWSSHPVDGCRIVYELIDSYLAVPPLALTSLLRGAAKFVSRENRRPALNYRKAMIAMCRRADAVICATDEQRADILPHCPNVHIVLDVHTPLVRRCKIDYRRSNGLNMVWEGLPQNLAAFAQIAPVLRDLSRRIPFTMHLVTDATYYRYSGRFVRRQTERVARRLFDSFELHPWDDETLSAVLTACDLAVIPLQQDDPLARGKPENKLLIFWRMGVPALTSATPAYTRAMASAGLDMTCATTGEWSDKIERYASDEDARQRAGRAGRLFADDHHSEEAILRRWDAVFESVLPG